uniref:Uncharacterized protein n=1 Tax=Ditylum brightwellii TaxID=49249 RepID=A0A6U3S9B2_9STRA|mmetsp:Transcript_33249/g.49548  ORF Transcript_33249/g.49548 Transcript_33249/m.49548 type:complete len:287 (+) Transcript_33249:253-1113(+)
MVNENSPLLEAAVPINVNNLTADDIEKLRCIVQSFDDNKGSIEIDNNSVSSDCSDYPEFAETTHAWFVFGDARNALDRFIGTTILLFQIYVYFLFAGEAIGDYQSGTVHVSIAHSDCFASDESIDMQSNLVCDADQASTWDAFAAFFMLGIFLTSDIYQAYRAIKLAFKTSVFNLMFAVLAFVEVITALLSATISISQQLYVGHATDAIEVGVGLLFIRELSSRAYQGLRYNSKKRYMGFFVILTVTVLFGFFSHPVLVKAMTYENKIIEVVSKHEAIKQVLSKHE